MKFSVLQQDLLPALQTVSRSVGVRSSLPVLDNILLALEGKKLKVSATNLEIGIIKYVPVNVQEEGELTIPARTLVELISDVGQAKIEFESQGEVLNIRSGKFKAGINGIAAAEFPAIPLAKDEDCVFDKATLSSCASVLFAAAVDEGRPVLTGVLTEVKKGSVDFVATDGFRLAHRQVQLVLSERKGVEGFKSLIPKKTFEEVLRVVSEEDVDKITIAASGNQNQAVFSLGETVISSRLIEGQFPQWEKIIPREVATRILMDKEELGRALKLASVFARGEANIISLSSHKGGIILKSSAKQLGSQENEVEASFEGDEMEVAFNGKFLLDAVANSPASQIMIELSGPLSAALIKPVGVEGLEFIIMPVRIS